MLSDRNKEVIRGLLSSEAFYGLTEEENNHALRGASRKGPVWIVNVLLDTFEEKIRLADHPAKAAVLREGQENLRANRAEAERFAAALMGYA